MPLTSYDAIIARIAAGFASREQIDGDTPVAPVNLIGVVGPMHRAASIKSMPTPLPTGVTGYIPTRLHLFGSQNSDTYLFCKTASLGTLDIAGPTFTLENGGIPPQVTELGVTRTLPTALMIEAITNVTGTPGNLTVTYVDQDGNAQETSPSNVLGAGQAGTAGFVQLNAPDYGITQLVTATRTAGTTPAGTLRFHAVIPLCLLFYSTTAAVTKNFFGRDFNPVVLGAGDTLQCFNLLNAVALRAMGTITLVGDN